MRTQTYIQAGKELVRLALHSIQINVADFGKFKARIKQCSRGMSCKGACISKSVECRNPLAGQAKAYAGWIQMQIKAGSGSLASDLALKAAIKKAKPIIDEYGGESFNHGGLLKARIEGKEYFIKRTKSPELAQAEATAHELAKAWGMEGDVLSAKVVNVNDQSHVVTPFVNLENFRHPKGFPNVRPELLSREDASRMLTFDYVVGMTDRHIGNLALTGGKMKLIDHEFAFGNKVQTDYHQVGEFSGQTIKFNELYDYQRQLNKVDATPDRPTLIDRDIANKAISSLDSTLATLKQRGLSAAGYEKRIALLKEVLDSDDPSFENLSKRIGKDDYS